MVVVVVVKRLGVEGERIEMETGDVPYLILSFIHSFYSFIHSFIHVRMALVNLPLRRRICRHGTHRRC